MTQLLGVSLLGCDNVLRGQGYGITQGAVVNECGAKVE
jgi:hypothetical protein